MANKRAGCGWPGANEVCGVHGEVQWEPEGLARESTQPHTPTQHLERDFAHDAVAAGARALGGACAVKLAAL